MCLKPEPIASVPAETARVARAAFPRGHRYLTLRDQFGTIFTDARFASLFAACGRPAEAPWRLALVTLLQFAENLSDRQAADMVRRAVDWKYLLGLELADPGFDHTVLVEFRARLIEGSGALLLLETLLRHCQERGLLKARGKQRTDATHVLAAARARSRLEMLGEAVRHALESLSVAAPEWLRENCASHFQDWTERYGRPFDELRLPQGGDARDTLALSFGADGHTLLALAHAPDAPAWLREVPGVEILRRIWVQQYYHEAPRDGASPPRLRLRAPEDLPPAPVRLVSPFDPDARCGRKRTVQWQGYKVHMTETCDADAPLLITDVQTTHASAGDSAAIPAIQEALAGRGLLPGQQVVDAAYMEAAVVLASQDGHGVELLGRVEEDTSWQAREGTGFAAEDFTLDFEREQATCPAGKESIGWKEKQVRGRPVLQIRFSQRECGQCPHRAACTRSSASGRKLTVLPASEHAVLRKARERERDATFETDYAARAGVEGCLSQGVRMCGLRRSRYLGMAKVHLQHVTTAAAMNLLRIADWLRDIPRAKTRQSAFLRLAAA